MDLVLKLRELRRLSGLSQKDVSRLSGVGEKSLSSFETGERIDSLKVAQLQRILRVYGVDESEFFAEGFDDVVEQWDADGLRDILADLRELPPSVQSKLLEKFQVMVDAAFAAQPMGSSSHFPRTGTEWEMLTSRN